jgi:outer membrane protein assembly factor BamB
MQGAVAVNLNGTTDWAFIADPQFGDDDDTGGGVMVSNGNATFLNKNGTVYNVDIATGKSNWSSTVNPRRGLGGFASPGTDGSITVIGAGEIPTPAPAGIRAESASKPINLCKFVTGFTRKPNEVATGFVSKLVGVGPTGAMLWSIPMQSRIDAYPAINNHIAFIGMDTKMDAIDVRTGKILWSFTDPSGGLFNAGAVIVPSGLYIGDSNGNVYAFSLPASAASAVSEQVLKRR